jgi:hypothetical protein
MCHNIAQRVSQESPLSAEPCKPWLWGFTGGSLLACFETDMPNNIAFSLFDVSGKMTLATRPHDRDVAT